MTIGKKQRSTTKWNFLVHMSEDYGRMSGGWYVFYGGIWKYKKLPEEASVFWSAPHKGFIIRFRFWIPFTSA